MYLTHPLMVIYPCAKYGKPMSNKKMLWAGHESAQIDGQMDRQTDRQGDFYIPLLNFIHGGYKIM